MDTDTATTWEGIKRKVTTIGTSSTSIFQKLEKALQSRETEAQKMNALEESLHAGATQIAALRQELDTVRAAKDALEAQQRETGDQQSRDLASKIRQVERLTQMLNNKTQEFDNQKSLLEAATARVSALEQEVRVLTQTHSAALDAKAQELTREHETQMRALRAEKEAVLQQLEAAKRADQNWLRSINAEVGNLESKLGGFQTLLDQHAARIQNLSYAPLNEAIESARKNID